MVNENSALYKYLGMTTIPQLNGKSFDMRIVLSCNMP